MKLTKKSVARILGYVLLATVSIASGIFVAEKYVINRSHRQPGLVGMRFPQELDWQKSNKTLILALQKSCKYCSESMDFYQRLVPKAADARVRIVAILPDELHEAEGYLNNSKVAVAEIRSAQLSSLGIKGTPSLVLVDRSGTVEKAWEGKLPPAQEQEVFAYLAANKVNE